MRRQRSHRKHRNRSQRAYMRPEDARFSRFSGLDYGIWRGDLRGLLNRPGMEGGPVKSWAQADVTPEDIMRDLVSLLPSEPHCT